MDIIATQMAVSTASSIFSHIILNKLLSLFDKDGNQDVNLDDIIKSESGSEALRIAIDFIKKNNGIPNKHIFNLMKALLIKLWKTSPHEHEFNNLQYYAEIVKELSVEELHVLVTAYKVSKQSGYKYTHHVNAWAENILINSTIQHYQIIHRAMIKLYEKKLLFHSDGGERSLNGEFHIDNISDMPYNNLTGLGYAIIDSVYNEIKDKL